MTKQQQVSASAGFMKRYASALAANTARNRTLAARQAGVNTPAVLCSYGPMALLFQRVVPAAQPSLSQMVQALEQVNNMPGHGLLRFDPFLRILPRLAFAPTGIWDIVADLSAQNSASAWPEAAVIHGDFHPGQVLVDALHKVWLIDLDDLALAPPEADLGNLAAWIATQSAGHLKTQTIAALSRVLALRPKSDHALADHFCRIALVRRALKLAEKGQTWALDQVLLRA